MQSILALSCKEGNIFLRLSIFLLNEVCARAWEDRVKQKIIIIVFLKIILFYLFYSARSWDISKILFRNFNSPLKVSYNMLSAVFPKNIFLKGTRKAKLSNQHHSMVVCRNRVPLYWLIIATWIFYFPINHSFLKITTHSCNLLI